jgi:hypothetical protein
MRVCVYACMRLYLDVGGMPTLFVQEGEARHGSIGETSSGSRLNLVVGVRLTKAVRVRERGSLQSQTGSEMSSGSVLLSRCPLCRSISINLEAPGPDKHGNSTVC